MGRGGIDLAEEGARDREAVLTRGGGSLRGGGGGRKAFSGDVERPKLDGVRSSTDGTEMVGRETEVTAGLVADLEGRGGGGGADRPIGVSGCWVLSAGRGGITGRALPTNVAAGPSIGAGLIDRGAERSSKGLLSSIPAAGAELVELALPLRLTLINGLSGGVLGAVTERDDGGGAAAKREARALTELEGSAGAGSGGSLKGVVGGSGGIGEMGRLILRDGGTGGGVLRVEDEGRLGRVAKGTRGAVAGAGGD